MFCLASWTLHQQFLLIEYCVMAANLAGVLTQEYFVECCVIQCTAIAKCALGKFSSVSWKSALKVWLELITSYCRPTSLAAMKLLHITWKIECGCGHSDSKYVLINLSLLYYWTMFPNSLWILPYINNLAYWQILTLLLDLLTTPSGVIQVLPLATRTVKM